MSPRVASSVLHYLDEDYQNEILGSLPGALARSLRSLAKYEGETAGAIMEPRVVSLSSDLTVQQAIAVVRKAPHEALHYLYVTKRDGTLYGVLSMRDGLLRRSKRPVQVAPKSIYCTIDPVSADATIGQSWRLMLPRRV